MAFLDSFNTKTDILQQLLILHKTSLSYLSWFCMRELGDVILPGFGSASRLQTAVFPEWHEINQIEERKNFKEKMLPNVFKALKVNPKAIRLGKDGIASYATTGQ